MNRRDDSSANSGKEWKQNAGEKRRQNGGGPQLLQREYRCMIGQNKQVSKTEGDRGWVSRSVRQKARQGK